MRAFDFVITLYSLVYALAVAQILSTVGDDPCREAPSLLVGQCRLGAKCAPGDCRLVAEPVGP
jgi:hypothetical protein